MGKCHARAHEGRLSSEGGNVQGKEVKKLRRKEQTKQKKIK